MNPNQVLDCVMEPIHPAAAADVAALLQAEIDRLKDEQTKGGTSTWVLAVSVAAVGLFCANMWSMDVDLNVLYKAITVAAFTLYPLISWFWEIDTWGKVHSDPSRTRLANAVFATDRTPLSVMAVLGAILIWIIWKGRHGVNVVSTFLAVAAVSLSVALALGGIAVSFTSLEIPGNTPGKGTKSGRIAAALIVAWTLLALVGFVRGLPRPFLPDHLLEAKLAVGLFVLGLTIRLLAGQSHRDPAYWELVRIRREVLLSRISPEEGRRQTELALLGLDAAARADLWLRRAIAANEAAEVALATLEATLTKLEQVLEGSRSSASEVRRLVRRQEKRGTKALARARNALVQSYRAFSKVRRLSQAETGPSSYTILLELRARRSAVYPRYSVARRLIAEWRGSERRHVLFADPMAGTIQRDSGTSK